VFLIISLLSAPATLNALASFNLISAAVPVNAPAPIKSII
jgi:hypothetical protein